MSQLKTNLALIFISIYWIFQPFSLIFLFGILFLICIEAIYLGKFPLITVKDYLFIPYAGICVYNIFHGYDDYRIFLRITVYAWVISFVFQNIDCTSQNLKKIVNMIGITTFLTTIFLFFHRGHGHFNFSFSYLLSRGRLEYFLFDNFVPIGPTQLSSLLTVCLIILTLKILKREDSLFFSTIEIVAALFVLLMILIASSRTCFISVIAISIYIFWKFEIFKLKILLMSTIVLTSLSIVALYFMPKFDFLQSYQFKNQMAFFSDPVYGSALNPRLIRWDRAWNHFLEKPLEGFGFRFFIWDNPHMATPHNEVLTQLVGVGLLGMVPIFGIYIFCALKIIKFQNQEDPHIKTFGICFLIFLFFISLTESLSYGMNNLFYPIIWIVFGLFSGRNSSHSSRV